MVVLVLLWEASADAGHRRQLRGHARTQARWAPAPIWGDSEIPQKIAGPEKYAFLAFNTKTNRKNKDFTHFVFPHFSRLTVGFPYF